MIKLAIVDDKLVNRKTVKYNLAPANDIEIIFETENGSLFLEKMNEINADQYPDIVLMDIDMPLLNGIETVAIATIKYPQIKFLMLTIFDDDEKIFEAIQAGAHGYLLKDDTAEQLKEAIANTIKFNGIPMSPAIARKTLQWMKSIVFPTAKAKNLTDSDILSGREIEILKLMVEGLDYKKIADKLFISPLTVRTHISKIYDKLHINSKAQAIQIAHKFGWA